MISEKQLSQFHSFWQHHYPLLDPTFIRRFNAGKERLRAADGSAIHPISMGSNVERFDLVAELAFELAVEKYTATSPSFENATQRALSTILLLRGGSDIEQPTIEEISEAKALFRNYQHFFDTVARKTELKFRPQIKGAGILDAMQGDFCSQTVLFEVKTVNRNLLSSDLRQVICYLVAGLGSREYSWTEYCIFNPRLAVYHTGGVTELLSYLSGLSAPECIHDVLDALMEREQPLEIKF